MGENVILDIYDSYSNFPAMYSFDCFSERML